MDEEYKKPTKKCFAVCDILPSLNRVSQCNDNIKINLCPNFAFLIEKSQAAGFGKLYVIWFRKNESSTYLLAYFLLCQESWRKLTWNSGFYLAITRFFARSHLLFIFCLQVHRKGKRQNMFTTNHVCCRNLDVSSLLPNKFSVKNKFSLSWVVYDN